MLYSPITSEIHREIENYLAQFGLFFRCFSRTKPTHSLEKKIKSKCESGCYTKNVKMLQDAIGVRIVLYFPEDIETVVFLLKKKFEIVDDAIDNPKETDFSPTRCNLIFRIQISKVPEFKAIYKKFDGYIDSTYEVQVRTIFSEGWHEVEHDFRYKSKECWNNHKDISRVLNGINASLVAAEWSLEKIFDELSYRFYKNRDWELMLKNKIRLRFDGDKLCEDLSTIFSNDINIAKKFFRINKNSFLQLLTSTNLNHPLSLDNIIYIYNVMEIKNKEIYDITPRLIIEQFDHEPIIQ